MKNLSQNINQNFWLFLKCYSYIYKSNSNILKQNIGNLKCLHLSTNWENKCNKKVDYGNGVASYHQMGWFLSARWIQSVWINTIFLLIFSHKNYVGWTFFNSNWINKINFIQSLQLNFLHLHRILCCNSCKDPSSMLC